MTNNMTTCIFAFLLISIQSCIADDKDVNLLYLKLRDPWLSYYDRFSENHMECSTVAGTLWIQPSYVRVLLYFDDTQNYPMMLSNGSREPDPEVLITNKFCAIKLSFFRAFSWDRLTEGTLASLSNTSSSLPRSENPEMMTEVHYDKINNSCSQLEIPFFINRNGFTMTQSSSFKLGYNISSSSTRNGMFFMHSLEKPGCNMMLRISVSIQYHGNWKSQTFIHK